MQLSKQVIVLKGVDDNGPVADESKTLLTHESIENNFHTVALFPRFDKKGKPIKNNSNVESQDSTSRLLNYPATK
jgi:hypothetical protein